MSVPGHGKGVDVDMLALDNRMALAIDQLFLNVRFAGLLATWC